MKYAINFIVILGLSSCAYINEEIIKDDEAIEIQTFLGEISNIDDNIEEIEDIEINIEDILNANSENGENGEKITEEDIKELINILFENN